MAEDQGEFHGVEHARGLDAVQVVGAGVGEGRLGLARAGDEAGEHVDDHVVGSTSGAGAEGGVEAVARELGLGLLLVPAGDAEAGLVGQLDQAPEPVDRDAGAHPDLGVGAGLGLDPHVQPGDRAGAVQIGQNTAEPAAVVELLGAEVVLGQQRARGIEHPLGGEVRHQVVVERAHAPSPSSRGSRLAASRRKAPPSRLAWICTPGRRS